MPFKPSAFLLFTLFFGVDLFATINVSNTTELQNAITTANIAPDTIVFTNSITLTGPLPSIGNTYTINGAGFSLDGASTYRGFLVLGGLSSPTITNLTITNTVAQGGAGGESETQGGGSGGGGLGAGGGVYIGHGGSVTIDSSIFDTCTAVGGDSTHPAGGSNTCAGGGGSSSGYRDGSSGGFGGGGGGGGRRTGVGGSSLFGGGTGGNGMGSSGESGGGGAALGGALFIDSTSTATLTVTSHPFSGSALTGGSGASSGQALGTDIFLASGGILIFNIPYETTMGYKGAIHQGLFEMKWNL